jgi:hypothetical protein
MESTLLWLATVGPYTYLPIQVFKNTASPNPVTRQIFPFSELTFY